MLYLNLLLALELFATTPNFPEFSNCTVITSQRDTIVGVFVSADNTLTIRPIWNNRQIVLQPQQVFEYALTRPDGTQDFYQFVTKPGTKLLKAMRRLVNGDLKLFEDKEKRVSTVNPGLPKGASTPSQIKVYYVGAYSEDVVILTAQNWKPVLKERLKECPQLVENLGKRCYRFVNLPGIIAAYNVCRERILVNVKE